MPFDSWHCKWSNTCLTNRCCTFSGEWLQIILQTFPWLQKERERQICCSVYKIFMNNFDNAIRLELNELYIFCLALRYIKVQCGWNKSFGHMSAKLFSQMMSVINMISLYKIQLYIYTSYICINQKLDLLKITIRFPCLLHISHF